MVTIKSPEEIKYMREAGKLNYQTRMYLKDFIKPGITTGELNDLADAYIREHGGIPGFLNYEGYPGSVCISVNDEVVHGIPGSRVLQEGDIVSIDIGVIMHGYHSDAAWTFPVGKISREKEYLLNHTEKALYAGLKEIKNGAKLCNISARIEQYAKKHNLSVIKELVGHGIGTSLHEEPDVPNFGKYNTGMVLRTGMTLAVEPMLNLGSRHIYILDDDWTIVTRDGKPSAHFEATIVVTDEGYEILTGE